MLCMLCNWVSLLTFIHLYIHCLRQKIHFIDLHPGTQHTLFTMVTLEQYKCWTWYCSCFQQTSILDVVLFFGLAHVWRSCILREKAPVKLIPLTCGFNGVCWKHVRLYYLTVSVGCRVFKQFYKSSFEKPLFLADMANVNLFVRYH